MVIPIGDEPSGLRTPPYVVYGLIAINVLVWLLQLQVGESFTNGWSTVPYEITHGQDLIGTRTVMAGGEAFPVRLYPGPTPIYFTLLSAMFMHGSWLHILGNMLYLWIFGDQIEYLLGRGRFIVFYLLCGLAASLAQILYSPEAVVPSLGASGAIAGVLGAYMIKFPRNRVRVLMGRGVTTMPALMVLGLWILLQFFSQVGTPAGEATGVAYMAHIGGFVAGIALVLLMTAGRRASSVRVSS
jgi:membrane associated rhomboid family serine protease